MPGEGADQTADDEREGYGGDRDAQIEPGGDDGARQNVASERVGAEPVRPRRRRQRLAGLRGEGVETKGAMAGPTSASATKKRKSAAAMADSGFSPTT